MIQLTKKRRVWKQNGEVVNDPTQDFTGTITSGGNPNFEYLEEDTVSNINNHLPDLPQEGEWVESGKTYAYGDDMVKCIQGHNRMHYEPSETPALFNIIPNDGSEYPEWQQPTGSHDAYNTGDRVWYPDKDGNVYESTIDANVWSPEEYPQGWNLI